MISLKLAALALTFLRVLAADVQVPEGIEVESVEDLNSPSQQQSPNLAVEIKTSFPQSELFGVKLVNGHPTRAVFDITNKEPEPVTVHLVTGSLWSLTERPGAAPQTRTPVKNLTATRYGAEIPAGESESLTYNFALELHPQDLNLALVMMLQNKEKIFTQVVFNETVSVVEAPVSFFDPQIIFLYLFLAAAFGGTIYFVYITWITTLFPQKRRGGKGGERAKRSSGGSKKVDPADQVSVIGADGPAVTSGAKAYDESWIPAGHLTRPEARRVGSGRPKSRAA